MPISPGMPDSLSGLNSTYDAPENRAFLTKYGAEAHPYSSSSIPRDEHVTATQPGAMSLQELKHSSTGEQRGLCGRVNTQPMPRWRVATPSALCSRKRPSKAYQEALHLARHLGPSANCRASSCGALQDASQWQECAENSGEGSGSYDAKQHFGRTLVTGCGAWFRQILTLVGSGGTLARAPFEGSAFSVRNSARPSRRTLSDSHDLSVARNDNASAAKWASSGWRNSTQSNQQ